MATSESEYQLAPSSATSSMLRRNAQELGELWLDADRGNLTAVWSADRPVHPKDAALGYALAVAFGTGAEPALTLLMQRPTEVSDAQPPGPRAGPPRTGVVVLAS